MNMSNSSLVSYTWQGSTSNSNPRDHVIDTITIHHMAANGSLEGCFKTLAYKQNPGSVNYGIDSDGRIGLMIPENLRAWTSDSRPNDMRAVTIEVANDQPSDDGGWHVSDKAYAALINLCADICKRNGKNTMIWCSTLALTNARTFKANEMRMTIHQWFVPTGCPGAYLLSKMPDIAAQVTKKIQQPTNRVQATHSCYTYGSNSKGMPDVNGAYPSGSQWTVEKVISYAGQQWGKIKGSNNWIRMSDVKYV